MRVLWARQSRAKPSGLLYLLLVNADNGLGAQRGAVAGVHSLKCRYLLTTERTG